jgi:hypothetical protein
LPSRSQRRASAKVLTGVIEQHVVTQRAVGTPGQADWRIEYTPYKPSWKEVRGLLTATTWKTGSLIARVGEA